MLDPLGRHLRSSAFPTTAHGYAALEAQALGFGAVESFGIEGTGSWSAGLSRWPAARGHALIEVNRPDRSARRRTGKSDATDAEQAARAVQAGTATGQPKSADGPVEMLRVDVRLRPPTTSPARAPARHAPAWIRARIVPEASTRRARAATGL